MKRRKTWNMRMTGGLIAVLLSIGISASPATAAVNDPEIIWNSTFPTININGIREQSGITSLGGADYHSDTPFFLARVNEQGKIIWSKTLTATEKVLGRGVRASKVIPSLDGGFILLGSYTRQIRGEYLYLAKADKNGNLLWENILDTNDWQNVPSIIETNDHGITLILNGDNPRTGRSEIIKYNSMGQLDWTYRTGYYTPVIYTGQANTVREDADGNYYATGISDGEDTLWKLNSSGELIWKKPFKSNDKIAVAPDGGVTGITYNAENGKFNLMKLDRNGQQDWSKAVGSGEVESLEPAYDGGYVITNNEGIYLTQANGELKSYTPLDKVHLAESASHGIVAASGIFAPTTITFLSTENAAPTDQPDASTDSIAFSDEEYSISIGETLSTQILALKKSKTYNVTQDSVISSTDPTVVTIDHEGNFTGLKKGATTLIATYEGKTTSVNVNVY